MFHLNSSRPALSITKQSSIIWVHLAFPLLGHVCSCPVQYCCAMYLGTYVPYAVKLSSMLLPCFSCSVPLLPLYICTYVHTSLRDFVTHTHHLHITLTQLVSCAQLVAPTCLFVEHHEIELCATFCIDRHVPSPCGLILLLLLAFKVRLSCSLSAHNVSYALCLPYLSLSTSHYH